jgi:hypothetical protein
MSIKDDVLAPSSIGALVIFEPDLRIWSGQVKVRRAEDLKSIEGELPPKKIFSEGLKPLIDLKHLQPYDAVRKRVERLLAKEGIKLPRGKWGVPPSEAVRVAEELDSIGDDFDAITPGLLANLEDYYAEHEAAYPQWSKFLSRGRPKLQEVEAAIHYKIAVYRTAQADPSNPESILNKRFDKDNDAVPALLDELAKRSDKLLDGPLGKGQATGVAQANALRTMVAKMRNFSFIDQRVGPAAKALDSMLSSVPHAGSCTIGHAAVIKLVAEILADPNRVLGLADVEGETVDDDPRVITSSPASTQQAPASAPAGLGAFAV